jgi:uncharacterized protein
MNFKCKEMKGKYFLYFMNGETNLQLLIKNMKPELHAGEYVFIRVDDITQFGISKAICFFKEKEGCTVIVEKHIADEWKQPYQYVAAWITLSVHSSLEAVGLTAAFSKALSEAGISCNVVAAYYHDHIFVDVKDAVKAMEVLQRMAE